MSQFQFEQELHFAMSNMDTSIHVGPKIASRLSRSTAMTSTSFNSRGGTGGPSSSSSSSSLSTSYRLPSSSNNNNRSQSESRTLLHPSLGKPTTNTSKSPNRRSRSKTPTRLPSSCTNSGSLLDLSSAGLQQQQPRATTPCRGDRFIPNRSTTDLEYVQHSMARSRDDLASLAAGGGGGGGLGGGNGNGENSNQSSSSSSQAAATEQLRRQKMGELLMNDLESKTRILSFSNKAPAADETHANNLKVLYSTGKSKMGAASSARTRQVPSKSEKILDAPDLVDDFYLHLVDWSSNNHLAVALSTSLFIWNADDGSIAELFSRAAADDIVCSLRWVNEGNILAVGDVSGTVELWDVTASKTLRSMSGHTDRISTMDWNDYMLASGCRDGKVHLHDVRVASHHVATLDSHSQEVCGTAYSSHGRLLATGANDNLVLLWDPRNASAPVHSLTQHQSAVKAMSWCPWQPTTLATGGGTSDRSIKFWSSTTGECLRSVDSGSQVCSLVWNSEYNELVSGHGFSHNQLTIWSYPKMTKVADLRGHTSRILLVIPSPDGSTVASAAADETIRLWKIWPQMAKKAKTTTSAKEGGGMLSQRLIR